MDNLITSSLPAQTEPTKRGRFSPRFVLFSPQITVVTAVAVVLLIALVILAVVIVAQGEAGAEVLTFNDTNRVFVQLQRESLRLLALVAEPAADFDAKAVQTQSDLIESRVGVMNFPNSQASLPPTIQDRALQIQQQWTNLKQDIQAWMDDPSNVTLRETVKKNLTDFEFYANDTEVNYSRINVRAITDFAQLNQQQILGFSIGAVILVLFMFAVAISIYRFNQQRREVETVREANRLKDEFLATVSHELRTPLNAIIGFLGIMKMTRKLDEQTLHMVERSHANAMRLLSLINDILDISKIEAGKFELAPSVVSLRKMTERWQSQMDVLAKQKGLDFNVQVEDRLPDSLFVDEEAVTKIAVNLLSNAFKFTQKGKVSLTVKFGDPGEWTISVTDTGIGIPQDARERIFESFRQGDSSTRRMYGGTGLGLSIVRRLSKTMGGDIQVESTPGQGSTFTVSLPLQTAAQPQLAQPA